MMTTTMLFSLFLFAFLQLATQLALADGPARGDASTEQDSADCSKFTVGYCSDSLTGPKVRELCPTLCANAPPISGGEGGVNGQLSAHWRPPRESGCKDAPGVDCTASLHVCDNPTYEPLVSVDCRATCGFCVDAGYSCEDMNTQDCQRWNENKFCNNTDFPRGIRLKYCAKTCDMCPLAASAAVQQPT